MIPIFLEGKIKSVDQFTKLIRDNRKGMEGLKYFFAEKEFPITIGFHFVRPDKKEFRYTTLVNIVTKALHNVGLLKTLGCRTFMPVIIPVEKDGVPEWWTVNKKKHGVTMVIIKEKDIVAPDRPKGIIADTEDVRGDDSMTLKAGSILG